LETTFKLGAVSPASLSCLGQNLLRENVLLALLMNTGPGKKRIAGRRRGDSCL